MTTEFRIIHCFRAPVGGLFRHVCDLVAAQAQMGHRIGIVCDSRTGGEAARRRLHELAEHCALGLVRVPMSRQIGLRDVTALRAVRRFARQTEAQILHGHGAKGGAFARLAAHRLKRRGQGLFAFYTPHGGSLHYSRKSLAGRLYLWLERKLAPRTDGLLFESAYSARLYREKIATPACASEVVPNGLWPHEFYEAILDSDAADFLFIGELRELKGTDLFLAAMARLRERHPATAVVVGSGPQESAYQRMAKRLGLADAVSFPGTMPARAAFSRGQCLVVPSRAESFPYIVLEAAAARLPMILTDVGGIPEIVSGTEMQLVPPGDAAALAARMRAFLDDAGPFVEQARALQQVVSRRYTVAGMAQSVLALYQRVARSPGPT